MATDSHSSLLPVKLNKSVRTMPKWVTEGSDRIGPKPPAPPPTSAGTGHVKAPAVPPKTVHQPEPDYEVIEFSGQQYSNEPRQAFTVAHSKSPDTKLKCTLCGSNNPWVTCAECAQQIFCVSCDDMFHKHPKRKAHIRKAIETRPPIPPKMLPGQPGTAAPVAPPRRGKRGLVTPLMQCKDQVNLNGKQLPPLSPLNSRRSSPSKERVGSRGFLNRPLPDTPKTSNPSDDASSRSTTPKSVFDTIQRPPSVTLEKIKSKANATLDRMRQNHERYRQQKERSEDNRSKSVTDKNLFFDQWSSISPSPSHLCYGSMSSGLNSSHFDLSDDTSFHLFHQKRGQQQPQTMNSHPSSHKMTKNMSTSVMNLNHNQRRTPESRHVWMGGQMHQAQSVAQVNCVSCSHPQSPPQPYLNACHPRHMNNYPTGWYNQQDFNRSNLSLNIMPNQFAPQHKNNGMFPPPVFMNHPGIMGNLYTHPYPVEMPVMKPGLMGMPPSSRSRATSRAGSRLPSPSVSRKSNTLRRKRASYTEDEPTDDEDSDQDDRRSIISNRSARASASRNRDRRLSNSSYFLEGDSELNNSKSIPSKVRDQRRGSITKSTQMDWEPGRNSFVNNNIRASESTLGSRAKPFRIYSDLDSSDGSGTRALVQAKIQQKLDETPKESMQSEFIREPTQKISAESNFQPHNFKSEETRQEYRSKDKEEINEDRSETQLTAYENGIEEDNSSALGPPPQTPDYEWECEFCTFVNRPKVKICSICCKTPSKPPVNTATKATNSQKPTSEEREKHQYAEVPITQENQLERTITNELKSLEVNDTATVNTNDKLPAGRKDSLEDIWAILDENIQTTTDKIVRKSESSKAAKTNVGAATAVVAGVPKSQKQREKHTNTIGTSPPPSQSTSTQTLLPQRNKLEHNDGNARMYENGNKLSTKDSNQLPFLRPLDQNMQRLFDYKPIETEALINIEGNLRNYNDSHNSSERYRSQNDVRLADTATLDYSHSLGPNSERREPLINEVLSLQKLHSQMYPSLHGISHKSPNYDVQLAAAPGTELHFLLKEAELYNFTIEELRAALKCCGSDTHPIQWLRDNWQKLIQTVQSLATKYGQEHTELNIGTISLAEARNALCKHSGNIWLSVSECIEQRKRKFRELSKENFSRGDIVTALSANQGNMELALIELRKTQLEPFLMNIFGSPGGVENESGTNTLTPATTLIMNNPNTHTINTEIHDFLHLNASECSQRPIASGAFSTTHLPQLHDSPIDNRNEPSEQLINHNTKTTEHIDNHTNQELVEPIFNKNMLKDLESLIGTMEQNHANQNAKVLRSIETMLDNFAGKRDTDITTEPETMEPLATALATSPVNDDSKNTADLQNYVMQHIQEIVPQLVQQVGMELTERDNVDTRLVRKESNHSIEVPKDITRDLKSASIREDLPIDFVTVVELEDFKMPLDYVVEKVCDEFAVYSFTDAPKDIYKMYRAPLNEPQVYNLNEQHQDDFLSAAMNMINIDDISIASTSQLPDNLNQIKNTSDSSQVNSVNTSPAVLSISSHKPNNSIKLSRIPIRTSSTNSNSRHKMDTVNDVAPTLLYPPKIIHESDPFNSTEVIHDDGKDTNIENPKDGETYEIGNSTDDSQINKYSIDSGSDSIYNKETAEHSSDEELYSAASGNSMIDSPEIPHIDSEQPLILRDISQTFSTAPQEIILTENWLLARNIEPVTVREASTSEASKSNLSDMPENTHLTNNSLSIQRTQPVAIRETYSSETSKKNLSDMVENTHRLIRQMKDEITMDELESSEEDYTDEYDEFEEEEFEEEMEEEEEGEGDQEQDWDDQDTDTEEDKVQLDEEDSHVYEEEHSSKSDEDTENESVNDVRNYPTEQPEEAVQLPNLTNSDNRAAESISLLDNNSNENPEIPSITPQMSHIPIYKELHVLETVPRGNMNNIPLDSTFVETTQNSPAEVAPEFESNNNVAEPTENVSGNHVISDTTIVPNSEATETSEESHGNLNNELIASESITNHIEATMIEDYIELTSSTSTANENMLKNDETEVSATDTTAPPKSTARPTSTTSKIPQPKQVRKSQIKPPSRSKSFSGPSISMGMTSVKAIKQEYLNKQSQLGVASTTHKNPPTLVRKKSITEAITKLTKTISAKAAVKPLPSHLFRSSTQTRIPKKKYHETCFSDEDYDTTTEEESEPLKVSERKYSAPVFRAYPSIKEPEVINSELLANKLLDEKLVSNTAEAQIAAALVNMKFQQDVALWAAKECCDLDQAIALLRQECALCMNTFPMNQTVTMLKCTHKCCTQCAKAYFTVQITDRSINDCNCPFCKMPELYNDNTMEDENLEYFSNLDIFLKNILETEVHELFQRKLRDRSLLLDPNFRWCVQCSSGFFTRPKQKRVICPDCGSITCSQCRKTWEKQHEGLSCEKFTEWQQANDPKIQTQGVLEHLAQHGIDCPKCKFRYSLARGGCMHFTCTQCKFEFCYGCAKPFMMGAKCNISAYCSKLGLHAHHPRNCLFYLRDKIPLQLQYLLKENSVVFDVVNPSDNSREKKAKTPVRCPIPLQKETPNGLVDTVCNGDVPDNHAGMCRTHYVEYLTAKVAAARIDPLPIFDLTDCVQELRRRGIPLPERGPWDTDEIYKNMCAEVIKQNIPLESE